MIVNLSETNKSEESDEKTQDLATMASNALLAGGEKVLLQTAQVVMCNKDGLKCQVHVLMDIASHRIFMTEQMAKQLNLLPQRSESLSISTF